MAERKSYRRWNHTLDVVGLGFRLKKETRISLAKMIDERGSISGMRLVRETDNPADEHAIMVLLPERIMHGVHLGYLRRPAAELLAPKMDEGTLTVRSAKLLDLHEPDYKEGTLYVEFADILVPKGSTKPKSRS